MGRFEGIRFRRGTAAAWTSVNPTLDPGEPGFETDTLKVKIGDGAQPWSALPYISGAGGSTDAEIVRDTIAAALVQGANIAITPNDPGDTITIAATGVAQASHTHPESDVTNLVTDLSNKQPLDGDLTTIAGLNATTDNVIQSVSSAWASRTPAQLKSTLALAKGDVGLGNVDNTSDVNKPVSTAQQTALDGKQPLDSDLTTIAGLTATTDNFMVANASAWASRTPAQAKASLAIAESDVANLTTDLSNKQPLDSDLTTIAGLTATTNNMIQSVGSAWASRTPTQVTATLDAVTSTTKGLAPSSGGGTTNYLRADGSWAVPPGGSADGLGPDGDKGDITVGGTGTTLTIDNDAVTYAKIQNVTATDKVLGRVTAGAGDIEEIACTAAGRALIDDADTAAQRTTLGLVIGTNVQAQDADLTSLATNWIQASAAGASSLDFHEDTDNGANRVRLAGAASTADVTVTLPAATTTLVGTDTTDTLTNKSISLGTNPVTGTTAQFNTANTDADFYVTAGTDVALADGGTGASLTDPNADRIMFWDDSAGATTWLTPGTNLTITGTTIDAAGGGGGVSDGDKGDITVSGTGTVWTVDNDAITYAKIQNVTATDKLLGRVTAAAGDIEEIACTAAGRAILDDADAAAQRTTLGLVIGTDVQAASADLTSLVTNWVQASATGPSTLDFHEDTDNGTNRVRLSGAASTADVTVTLPAATTTLVGTDTTDTLTNKTVALGSNTVSGTTAQFNTANTDADFYVTAGTDVALADGGTGASLTDPNADRIMFWDDSAGATTWLTPGSGLTITGTTIDGGTPTGTKVSALTALTGANAAAGDLFNLVDVSDTTMAASGTNKSMTRDELIAMIKAQGLQRAVHNASVTTPAAGFAADTYLVGSSCAIPASSLQAKTKYHCLFDVAKTGAGTATPIINIRFGTAGSTADTSRGTLTFSAGTAVIDEGTFEIWATFRTVGSGTTAVIQTSGKASHRLVTTGLISVGAIEVKNATSAGFDSTVASSIVGLSVNGGTSAAWTITNVQSDLVNLA